MEGRHVKNRSERGDKDRKRSLRREEYKEREKFSEEVAVKGDILNCGVNNESLALTFSYVGLLLLLLS